MVKGKNSKINSLNVDDSTPVTVNDMLRISRELKSEIVSSLKEGFNSIGDRLENLELRIGNLESSIESFRRVQKKQEKEINEIKQSLSEIRVSKSEILDEIEDREKRRNNVIIFGLPECNEGTVSKRKKYDETLVKEVFEAIGCDDIDTETIFRLGRNIGKMRPVKVTLRNRISKAEIMRKARDLRTSDKYKKVFISNDKTKMQQTEWSDLRRELLHRRETDEDVVIYNGKVTQRSSLKNFRM